jgi:hypothetical protein
MHGVRASVDDAYLAGGLGVELAVHWCLHASRSSSSSSHDDGVALRVECNLTIGGHNLLLSFPKEFRRRFLEARIRPFQAIGRSVLMIDWITERLSGETRSSS